MNLRRTVSSVLLCALLVIDPVRLLGQTAPGFGEVLDVRVMNVDVVATDSRGNPVAGLAQGDFEIYEDGKRQDITNFYEVTAASVAETAQAAAAAAASGTAASAPASSRRFIFYVDNGTLSVKNRNEIFPAMTSFMEKNLLPGDQAMIVSWNRALNVRLPWTSDRTAIAATLKTLSGELGGAAELQGQKRRLEQLLNRMLAESIQVGEGRSQPGLSFEALESNARSYAEAVRHDISQSAGAMTKLLSSLSGVDGKKVLVLATESLPTQAGAEIFAALEDVRRQAMLAGSSSTLSGSARRGSGVGDLGKYNITPLIEALARTANATGVTIYAINPKGTDTQNSGKVELQDPGNVETEFSSAVQALDGVKLLAQRTGGRAMIGAPAEMALGELSRDLSSYYSIGYRARSGKSADRNVEVRSTRKGISVRARNAIYYRSMDTEMADRVLANHLQPDFVNAMKVAVESDPVTTDGSRKLLPMRVIIPADSLTLLPDAEGNLTGGFSVFTSAGNANGGGTGVDVQTQQIKWPAAQAAQMKGRRIGFALQIPMDKNPTQVSVGVVDHLSQSQGFATLKLQ